MGKPNDPGEDKSRKPYQKPIVTKLAPEEAKLKLVNLAKLGDQSAKEMLKMMFPEKQRNYRQTRRSRPENR
jgi:hypothetical protein